MVNYNTIPVYRHVLEMLINIFILQKSKPLKLVFKNIWNCLDILHLNLCTHSLVIKMKRKSQLKYWRHHALSTILFLQKIFPFDFLNRRRSWKRIPPSIVCYSFHMVKNCKFLCTCAILFFPFWPLSQLKTHLCKLTFSSAIVKRGFMCLKTF